MLRNLANFLNHLEDARGRQSSLLNGNADVVRQHTRNVLIETAAGDVAHAVDLRLFHRGEDGLYIDLGRAQQLFAQRAAELVDICAEIRVLPDGLCAKIDKSSLRTPPIFSMLQRMGSIPEHDMFNTYNMGTGMTLIAAKEDADRAIAALKENGQDAYVIGEVVSGEEKVALC